MTGDVTGNLVGDVTGNLTGNTTGLHTGNVIGNVTGDLTGNADTATAWATGRTITLTGEATGVTPSIDGTTNVSAALTLINSAVIGKVLTGLQSPAGATILATDSMLIAFGKLQSQINGIAEGLQFQGSWNATTNTPTLTSSVGTQGHYYIVGVAGSTNLNGITDWEVGDWAIFSTTGVWQRLDQTGVQGTGTTGNLTKWATGSTISDSIVSESGVNLTVTGSLTTTTDTNVEGNFVTNGSVTVLGTTVLAANASVNGTLTTASPVINTGISGSAVLDDDTFATASATTVATSESIKAYVDNNTGSGTAGTIPKFATGGESLEDSIITEASSVISVGGDVKINTAGSGASKLQVVGGIRNWNSALTLSSRLEADGLYFSGAQDVYVVSQQALNFYAGNALKMSISSLGVATFSGNLIANGNVGIGVTPSRKLDVQIGAGSSNGVGFINSNGKGLEIFTPNDTTNSDIVINQTSTDVADLFYKVNGSTKLTITSGGTATFTPSGGSVVLGSQGHITSTQALTAATSGGRFIGSSNIGVLGDIRIEQTATGVAGGYIRFMTSPSGSTSPTEKMRISSAGAIGQGVTPISDPYINGAEQWMTYQIGKGGVMGAYKANNESMFGFNTYLKHDDGANKAIISGIDGSAMRYYADRMTFNFLPSTGTAQSQNEVMSISSNGQVRIGNAITTNGILDVQYDVSTYNHPRFVDTRAYAEGRGTRIDFMGRFDSNGNTTRFGSIGAQKTNASNGSSMGYLNFLTNNGSTNSSKMVITGIGNVNIGSGSLGQASYQLRVDSDFDNGIYLSAGTSTNNHAIYAEDSSGTVLFRVRGDGAFYTGNASVSPYNNTTATASNLVITATDGNLSRSTASSRRYKENINDWNGNGLNTILSLKPKTFKYKKDYYDKADVDFLGLIAEEVAEVSPYLAEYQNEDRTGQVENVRYANIVVPLVKAIQEQQTIIDTLTARLDVLEKKA